MVMGMGLAVRQADQVGTQGHVRVQHHVSAEALPHRDGVGVQAQFFAEFAGQRGRFTLTGHDLATGQFPATGQLRRAAPLRDQHRARARRFGEDGAGDDDLGGHALGRYVIGIG